MNKYKVTTEGGEEIEFEADNLAEELDKRGIDKSTVTVELLDMPVPKKPSKKATEKKAIAKEPVVVEPVIDSREMPEQKALEHMNCIIALVKDSQLMFLKMGELLYGAREGAEWSILHYETFKEYIDDLQLPMTNSYSWATRLIGIYEYFIVKINLSEDDLLQIGVAKLSRLLPAAKNGNLTDELLEKAKVLSDMDLRIELGHNVGGGGTGDDMIVCPRCGNEISGAKWVNEGK